MNCFLKYSQTESTLTGLLCYQLNGFSQLNGLGDNYVLGKKGNRWLVL